MNILIQNNNNVLLVIEGPSLIFIDMKPNKICASFSSSSTAE